MTGACVGPKSAETIPTNPGPHASEGVCSDTEDAGEIEAECEASGVSGGEEQTRDDHSILWHRNVGIEGGYVYGLGMTRASCVLERGGRGRGMSTDSPSVYSGKNLSRGT